MWPLASHSSLHFPFVPLLLTLFLPSILVFVFVPLFSFLFTTNQYLCAYAVFIHKLVNTSVNGGSSIFTISLLIHPLTVKKSCLNSEGPALERMRRSFMSALRVLWPFTFSLPFFLTDPLHHWPSVSFSQSNFSFLVYLPFALLHADESTGRFISGFKWFYNAAGWDYDVFGLGSFVCKVREVGVLVVMRML